MSFGHFKLQLSASKLPPLPLSLVRTLLPALRRMWTVVPSRSLFISHASLFFYSHWLCHRNSSLPAELSYNCVFLDINLNLPTVSNKNKLSNLYLIVSDGLGIVFQGALLLLRLDLSWLNTSPSLLSDCPSCQTGATATTGGRYWPTSRSPRTLSDPYEDVVTELCGGPLRWSGSQQPL